MDFNNIVSDLNKPKSLDEYKYIFENYYIYTNKELKLILSTFINNFNFEIYPELIESYNQAFEQLKNK